MTIRGSDLRLAREEAKISVRRVALLANLSPGHLSRVEAGDRAVTPAVLQAYEAALSGGVAATPTSSESPGGAPIVEDMRRRRLLGRIAAASMGAAVTPPLTALLAGLPTPTLPNHVGASDVIALEHTSDWLTDLDLRYGGGLASEVASGSLRWGVGLLKKSMKDVTEGRLYAAVASLADRVGWAHYDMGNLGPAEHLFNLALNTAAQGSDPDLRAHIMLNLSTLVYDNDERTAAVDILRMGLGDERITAIERANLHIVCGRHLGGTGEREAALRHIGMGEEALAKIGTDQAAPWAKRVTASPGHFDSALGLALFATGEDVKARDRFTSALAALGHGRRRTALRCRTRLAVLDLRDGDLDKGTMEARQALEAAASVHSVRVRADLKMVELQARQRGLTDLAHDLAVAAA